MCIRDSFQTVCVSEVQGETANGRRIASIGPHFGRGFSIHPVSPTLIIAKPFIVLKLLFVPHMSLHLYVCAKRHSSACPNRIYTIRPARARTRCGEKLNVHSNAPSHSSTANSASLQFPFLVYSISFAHTILLVNPLKTVRVSSLKL